MGDGSRSAAFNHRQRSGWAGGLEKRFACFLKGGLLLCFFPCDFRWFP